jgi:hypothetical protein
MRTLRQELIDETRKLKAGGMPTRQAQDEARAVVNARRKQAPAPVKP